MQLNAMTDISSIPVVILCGGKGIYVDDSGQKINKALVNINGQAMVTWVMRHYAAAGFRHFILASGMPCAQLAAVLPSSTICHENEFEVQYAEATCRVRIVPTLPQANTGDRINACRTHLSEASCFCVTYSDTLSDVNLVEELNFHQTNGQIATLIAASYPVRFRILGMRLGESLIRGFAQRPVIETAPINGGYYIFNSEILSERYLGATKEHLVLENEVLEQLAADGKLRAYTHKGQWQNLDSERDLEALSAIAADTLR